MKLKDKIISSYFIEQKIQNPINNKYINNLRSSSINIFQKIGFPSLEDKEWKYIYSNLISLLKKDYIISFPKEENLIEKKNIKPYLLYNLDSFCLVFIDGVYNSFFSKINYKNKNIFILSHAFCFKEYSSIIENYYSKLIPKKNHFSILNTALSRDGAYIYIPEGTLVEKPIQILYISTGKKSNYVLSHPRNLIILGKNTNLKIIEYHYSLVNHFSLNNSVTEIYAHSHSNLEYFKIQNDASKTSLIDHTFISQDFGSQCSINTFSFGGNFIRNNLHIYQSDKKVNSKLKGLTLINNKTLVDHHTLIEHMRPNSKSYQIYKGIFDDKSIGVFNGKIIVHKKAKKINAFQKNNNILLSHNSIVNSKPELEIFSNDVHCSHGCTIGKLNEQALFYLRSRGIPKEKARSQLLFSFLTEIFENISILELKNYIYKIIVNKLNI